MNSSMEKLSTGMQINKAADNAAGLVISELQKAEVSGLSGAIDNINRGETWFRPRTRPWVKWAICC